MREFINLIEVGQGHFIIRLGQLLSSIELILNKMDELLSNPKIEIRLATIDYGGWVVKLEGSDTEFPWIKLMRCALGRTEKPVRTNPFPWCHPVQIALVRAASAN